MARNYPASADYQFYSDCLGLARGRLSALSVFH
jgi:hypothetical protein